MSCECHSSEAEHELALEDFRRQREFVYKAEEIMLVDAVDKVIQRWSEEEK